MWCSCRDQDLRICRKYQILKRTTWCIIKLISGHQGRQEARRADWWRVQAELSQDQSTQWYEIWAQCRCKVKRSSNFFHQQHYLLCPSGTIKADNECCYPSLNKTQHSWNIMTTLMFTKSKKPFNVQTSLLPLWFRGSVILLCIIKPPLSWLRAHCCCNECWKLRAA